MRGVNLLPAHRLLLQQKVRRLQRWGLACAALLFMLGASRLGVTLAATEGLERTAAERQRTTDRAAADRTLATELEPRLRDTTAALDAARAIGHQPDWSLLLALVARPLGEEVVLASCRLEPSTPGAHRLSLAGAARSHGAVLIYVRGLEQLRLFDTVTLLETRQDTHGEHQAVTFSIDCRLTATPPQRTLPPERAPSPESAPAPEGTPR